MIVINDLPDRVENSSIYLLADDLKHFEGIQDLSDCDNLQSDMNKIYSWSEESLLKFHSSKCKHTRITQSMAEPYEYYLHVGDPSLLMTESAEEKDLGVIIDTTLSFKRHSASKISKANSVLGLFEFLDEQHYIKCWCYLTCSARTKSGLLTKKANYKY